MFLQSQQANKCFPLINTDLAQLPTIKIEHVINDSRRKKSYYNKSDLWQETPEC